MLSQLKRAYERYLELESLLSRPETLSRPEQLRALMKEYSELSDLVALHRRLEENKGDILAAEQIAADPSADAEWRSFAHAELSALKAAREGMLLEAQTRLLPKDPNADRDVIVEIRGCAGGEDAALFAAVLFRMYSMYAAENGFRIELLSASPTELGGYKEIDFQISGTGVFSKFKFESGVHRVQRVPETESQGRIQTSTATVAVLPVVEDVDVSLSLADIVMETCKSSGAGGQHINKTESAVRLIHKPTGIVVECQEERSQFKNRDKAMKMLRARLYDIRMREREEAISSERRMQVGTGDRSERIRTYNYPQGRVTDHRIGLTLYTLDRFVNGEMGEVLSALSRAEAALFWQDKNREG